MRLPVLAALLPAVVAPSATKAQRSPMSPPERTEISAQPVTVPLIKKGEFYYMDVKVNGQPVQFTLETGGSLFAISARVAKTLGLRVDTVEMAPGMPSLRARVDSLNMGGVMLQQVAAVLDTRYADWIMVSDSLIPRLALAGPLRNAGTAWGPAQGTFEMRGARLTDSVTLGQYSLPRAAIVFRDRGIRENDRVLSFDGTAAELMNPAVFRAALQHGEPVKVVVDRDGMKLEFTVGSYALP